MAGKTEICNMAIARVGGNRIMNVDDGSPEAELCKDYYDTARDYVLEDGEWTFATRRYTLDSEAEEEPVWGYARRFKVPEEVLRIVEFNPAGVEWSLEDGHILTDHSVANIRATVKVTNPEVFSAQFTAALVSRLAVDLCLPLTQSPKLHTEIFGEYRVYLKGAKSTDGRQSKARRKTMSGAWRR